MLGTVGILGGNEMGPDCLAFDRALLAAAGGPPRVCVVPAAVVENGSVPAAMRQARAYFGALDLEVVHVELHRRADATKPAIVRLLRESQLTYLLGGDPGYLLDTLRESPAWEAIGAAVADGGAVAGSSAGAMVLGETLLLRSRNPSPRARHGRRALAILPGVVVIPHLNNFGDAWLEAARREAAGRDIVGLDEATGAIWAQGWRAFGPGVVKLWPRGQDPARVRRDGQSFRWRAPRAVT